ncbi:MAG: hypothetical protein K8S98_13990 [Planctomycetes bacterium]|nr:hypothetical protein [Planctomycetota bacterium]
MSTGELVSRVQVVDADPLAEPAPHLFVIEGGREVAVRWRSLTAADPQNQTFVICFEPLDGGGSERQLAPAFGDWRPESTGGHRIADGVWHHCACLGATAVERVSRATGLAPAKYVDRPVKLVAQFGTTPADIGPGQDVRVRLVVTNEGAEPVRWICGGWTRFATRHGRFRFHATRDTLELRDIGSSDSAGGISVEAELAPGAALEDEAFLPSWFDLSEPGEYSIAAEYDLPIVAPVPHFTNANVCPSVAASIVEVLHGNMSVRVQ